MCMMIINDVLLCYLCLLERASISLDYVKLIVRSRVWIVTARTGPYYLMAMDADMLCLQNNVIALNY